MLKKVLTRYILFDSAEGAAPYFYLLALIFPISALLTSPAPLSLRWFGWLLLGGFYLSYRKLYQHTGMMKTMLVSQMLLTLYFQFAYNVYGMILFSAFIIGSIPVTKPQRRVLFSIYYGALGLEFIGIGWQVSRQHTGFTNGDIPWLLFLSMFMLVAPLAANSARNSWEKGKYLEQNNTRLTDIVKRSEQNRIARELHDTLGQSFSMITVKTELASKLLAKEQTAATQAQLVEIEQMSRENLQLVRNIVRELKQKNIAEVLVEQVANLQQVGIKCQTHTEAVSTDWPRKQQVLFGAIIKEAVTNIIRHSKASKVDMYFTNLEDSFELKISDNGSEIVDNTTQSNGIKGMYERVAQAAGQLTITSDKYVTTIICQLPMENFR